MTIAKYKEKLLDEFEVRTDAWTYADFEKRMCELKPGRNNSYHPVLFMRALKVTHFRQLDDPLTVFGLEGTIFGSVFTLSA